MIKLGPSDGNSGALLRWGERLDNGLWASWRHPKLWVKVKFLTGYVRFGPLVFRWGNKGRPDGETL